MSKSKGNGVDPVDVMEKFGADSLRFGLAYLTTETQDVRMAGRVRVPALPEADRADPREPHPAADQVQALRPAVFDAMGRKAGRQGPAARGRGERPLRAGPQFLQQTVERLAVRPDEPRRLRSGQGGRRRTAGRGFVDPQPAGDRDAAGDRRAGRISLCRRRPRALRFRLGRVLQFLRGDGQGPAARRVAARRWPSGCWPTRSTRCCGCCTR